MSVEGREYRRQKRKYKERGKREGETSRVQLQGKPPRVGVRPNRYFHAGRTAKTSLTPLSYKHISPHLRFSVHYELIARLLNSEKIQLYSKYRKNTVNTVFTASVKF